VESFAYDPDSNSLYAGGSFTKVGATDASRIVKLHTNGPSVGTPFAGFPTGSGFNSTVRAIAKDPAGNSVYVGGEFSMYDGNPHARLVKLNSNGLVDSLFATGNGFTLSSLGSASVNALLVNGSSLFVGGEFDGFKDEPVGRVVKLDSAGELDTAFDVGNGPNQPVLALALRGSDLFVGGHFTSYAGNSGAQRLARVSALNGELATDILYNINGTVRALAVDAIGGVYAGGSFTTVNGAITGPLARILSTNSLDSSFVAAGTGHLNANQAAGVYTLQPFATADTPPFNMLFTCGLFSAFKYLSSPSANLWQSP
ncbi:hypothetical protein EBR21_06865, partial [bacterium]|nr:hypothetical protein [bacterium]